MTGEELQKAQDWASRKYRSAWALTIIFICLFTLPPLSAMLITLLWKSVTFTLLPVEAFVTFISLIWATYFGANVAEKHKSFTTKALVTTDLLGEVLEDEGSGLGGQPSDTDNP